MRDKHYDNFIHPIRGRVYDEDMIVDIKEFNINNLNDNEFRSTYKDRNFCIDDFIYFILPKEIFKEIYTQAYQKGIEDGKQLNIKKNYKVSNINDKE